MERYLISAVPACHALFHLAGRQTQAITQEKFEGAVGFGLTTWGRGGGEEDHFYALNSAIWGFLSLCLTGEAQTIPKQAETLMGLEAWRRISRVIDHGREIRPETLRNEVRAIRGRFVIKNLEDVIIGIAKFENKITEFADAGGKRPDDQEMKSDLNATLTAKPSELLCIKQTDVKMGHGSFKNFVEGQVSQILMNSNRLPVNAVDGREPEANEDDGTDSEDCNLHDMSRDDIIAMV